MTRGKRIFALVLLLTLVVLSKPAAARKSVLLVFDEDKDFPGLSMINQSLQDSFRARLESEVQFYSESLNLSLFKDPGYDDVLRDHFRRKYAGKRLDLIVAIMGPSLDFLLRHEEVLFPKVPIVFCGPNSSDIANKPMRENISGVLVKRTFAPTLDIALRLHPDTRNVYVVGGTSRFDLKLQAIARQEIKQFENRVLITWLTTLSMDDLLKTLSRLPEHSMVLYLTLIADVAGQTFSPHVALSLITGVANAPVYASFDQYMGLGVVGGHVYSISTLGRRAAEIGLRILGGETASSIPIIESVDYKNMFDWRQLQRWGIDERRLPADSIVSFRTPSIWDMYKRYIVGGTIVFLLQSALIGGLLVSRAQRRRADNAARESERRRQEAEEEVQRQRGELAHALRVTTLGELTASFAHEIKQPLCAILLNADVIHQLLETNHATAEDIENALADIAGSARLATETIDRLRAMFRKQRSERSPVDVNKLIDDMLVLLVTDIRRARITIYFRREEMVPYVLGDPIQLRQVVLNLLVNAKDAIAIAAIGAREIYIDTSRTQAGRVAIAIRDSGVGVSESELERIFESFVSSKQEGLGMGLAICRSIIKAHDGHIWATRNDDRGLTLHIELPAGPETQINPEAVAQSGYAAPSRS